MPSREVLRDRRKKYVSRQVTVYAPSTEVLEEWRERAEEGGLTLNGFILECIEIATNEKPAPVDDSDLINQLKAEVRTLQEELRRARLAVQHERGLRVTAEATEEDLQLWRNNIATLLRQGGVWSSQKLITEFNLGMRDLGSVKTIARVLKNLEAMGLVEETDGGWKWSP